MPPSIRRTLAPLTAAGTLVVLGAMVRLRHLGADPVSATWFGWILDEGRWTELAREAALFGAVEIDSTVSAMHLLLAPLYQLASYVSFSLLGVDITSARAVSVVAGIALLTLVGWGVRRGAGGAAALVAIVLVAFDPELVFASRVALPGMTSLLCATAAFFALTLAPRTSSRAGLAGVLVAMTLATQVTTAPSLIALLPILWITGRDQEPGTARTRALAFAAGVVIPAALLAVAALVLGGAPSIDIGSAIGQIWGFVAVNGPNAAIATLVTGGWGRALPPDPSDLNLLLAGVWLSATLGWTYRDRAPETATLLVAALIWIAGSLVARAVLAYYPERWVVHAHVPAAIAIAAGTALLWHAGRSPQAAGTARRTRWPERLIIAFPATVVVAPLVGSVAAASGFEITRIRERLGLLIVLLALCGLSGILTRGREKPGLLVASVTFPLLALLLWRVAAGPYTVGTYWSLGIGPGMHFALVGSGALGAAVIAWTVRGIARPTAVATIVAAYAAGLGVTWLGDTVRVPPPTYVLREISEELLRVSRSSPGAMVGSAKAATAILGTPLSHREISNAADAPDLLVASKWRWWNPITNNEGALPGHRIIREFELPRFPSQAEPVVVRVYERSRDPDY